MGCVHLRASDRAAERSDAATGARPAGGTRGLGGEVEGRLAQRTADNEMVRSLLADANLHGVRLHVDGNRLSFHFSEQQHRKKTAESWGEPELGGVSERPVMNERLQKLSSVARDAKGDRRMSSDHLSGRYGEAVVIKVQDGMAHVHLLCELHRVDECLVECYGDAHDLGL